MEPWHFLGHCLVCRLKGFVPTNTNQHAEASYDCPQAGPYVGQAVVLYDQAQSPSQFLLVRAAVESLSLLEQVSNLVEHAYAGHRHSRHDKSVHNDASAGRHFGGVAVLKATEQVDLASPHQTPARGHGTNDPDIIVEEAAHTGLLLLQRLASYDLSWLRPKHNPPHCSASEEAHGDADEDGHAVVHVLSRLAVKNWHEPFHRSFLEREAIT
mmetsp:Transcript_36750/g.84834  ORF Transcript_36750/g.84834 Transcript_36750/m.84834 type:complete len:212 (+) Transcript_36750:455-1090(+)